MHPVFQIQLLNDFRLSYDDIPVMVNSTRLQSLFAYLVMHRQAAQPRRHIAFLMWPDSTESQAYTNLRRELHNLRRILPGSDQFLEIDNAFVQWRPDSAFTLDVMQFQNLLLKVEQAEDTNPATRAQLLQEALACYRGPLLPNCYDEWAVTLRNELEQLFISALNQLVATLEEEREYFAAIRAAERLLHHDHLLESTYRALMRLHALNNDRARALRVYHDCCAKLEQEVGVEPTLETQRLYAQLLQAETSVYESTRMRKSMLSGTALVGRQSAWQSLMTTFRVASSRHARMVLISGEAGIGKSRLTEELLVWAEQQGILSANSRAYMAQGSLAYAPVIELLRTKALRACWQKLDTVWLEELALLLPELRSVSPTLSTTSVHFEPWRRRHLMEALARALLADDVPRLLVIDDLQWCDEESLLLLQFLFDFAPRARLLIVGTARPEEITPDHALAVLRRNLQQHEQLVEINLEPLSAAEAATLAAQVSGRELKPEMANQLYQETEGNPLFIVEAMRASLLPAAQGDVAKSRQSADAPNPLSSSPKIFAVIQSRLAQLSPAAHQLIGVAASIGRSFTYELLVAASGIDEDDAIRSLDELWQRRIIRAQGINTYDFSHDRIRDVAYAEISPIRRPSLHRHIAEALEQVFAADLDAVASQLAAHYEQSGLAERAIQWHQRAAVVHRRLCATRDAIKHLQTALDLVVTLPDSRARDQQEITLLIDLDSSIAVAYGLAAIGRLKPLERALVLAQELGDRRQLFEAMEKLQHFHMGHQGVHVAFVMTEELVQIANELDDPFLKWRAFRHRGRAHRARGEFSEGYTRQMQARTIHEKLTASLSPYELVHQDLLVVSPLDILGLDLCVLGYLDQARTHADNLAASARQDSFQLTNDYFVASLVYRIVGNVEKVHELGERMVKLGTRYELAMSIWSGTICCGWALARRGQLAAGITQMNWGIDQFRQVGHTMFQTIRLGDLAALYMQANQLEAAEAALQEARSISEHAHERLWDAEIHRLTGNLALALEEPEADIELHYVRAYELARSQQAKIFELRAATSLARLWQQQGSPARAYTLLAETLSWFTEGFDTPDLKSATALLNDLKFAQNA